MGRIKTILVKRFTHELMQKHGEKLSDDFEKNKEIINTLVTTPSKKLRNIVAGYATRLIVIEKNGSSPRRPSVSEPNEQDESY